MTPDGRAKPDAHSRCQLRKREAVLCVSPRLSIGLAKFQLSHVMKHCPLTGGLLAAQEALASLAQHTAA